jgi:NADPH2:quinone reductase
MKAIRVHEFGGPEKLVLEEVPDLTPGAGEVVVDVHAAGVNPVDTYIRTGTYAMKPQLPYTPGADGAGIVRSTGQGVTTVKPGDRVYIAGSLTGTYAQQSLSKAAQVHPLTPKASFEQGAAIGVPYGTAYRGVFHKAKGKKGETILVHGASGGTGLAAVQLAKSIGMNVIGTASTEKGRKLVRDNGASHALDHSAPDMKEQLLKLTNGAGVDVIIEMLANKNLVADFAMIAKHGRIVIIGNRGSIEINPRDGMAKDAEIYPFTLFNATPEELASIHADLVAKLANGDIKPVIDEQIPLADARRAHEAVLAPGSFGKIVLKP